MKKTTRVMLAVILAVTLCLGIVPAAHAGPVTDPSTVREAAITKVLKVPVGTEYPAMDFNFLVAAVSFNESTTLPADMPIIGNVTISFDGAAAAAPAEEFEGLVAGVETYYLESDELFGGIDWPMAGRYEYRVTELGTDYMIVDSNHEAFELSQAVYTLVVYVREYDADDAAAGRIPPGKSIKDPYIWGIGMFRVVTDDGQPSGYKGDPTPGGDQITSFYSDMIFTNKYVKTNGAPDPDDPDPTDPGASTLSVTKTVAGDLGSQVLPFNFTFTLNVPTLIADYVLPYYKAYLVEGSNVLDPTDTVDDLLIGTDASGVKFVKIAPFAAMNFELTGGQKLVIINAPVGTSYSLSEAGETGYVASVRVTYNGFQGAPDTGTRGNGISLASALVGEAANLADVTNTFDLTPPAGLTLENLPFYTLILLSLGALVVFIAMRRRKRQEEV